MEENTVDNAHEKNNEDSLEIIIRQFKTEEDLRHLLPIEQASFNEPWRERYFYRMVMGHDKGALMAQIKVRSLTPHTAASPANRCTLLGRRLHWLLSVDVARP
jgi:hypothetical protein